MVKMISWTKTEIVIEDDDDFEEENQINLDWWIARTEYFKNRCMLLEKENKELRKKQKNKLTDKL